MLSAPDNPQSCKSSVFSIKHFQIDAGVDPGACLQFLSLSVISVDHKGWLTLNKLPSTGLSSPLSSEKSIISFVDAPECAMSYARHKTVSSPLIIFSLQ